MPKSNNLGLRDWRLDTPSRIRNIFGDNLRALAQDFGSVTAVAEALDINRTQYNRYLSGESFPRPDVLSRICTFFGVDARILLEPLATLRPSPAQTPPFLDGYVAAGAQHLSDDIFPYGFYRFSRRSFIDPDRFVVGLVHVFRRDDYTFLRGYETRQAMRLQSLPTDAPLREFRGVVLQQQEGIAILASRKNAMTTSFNYLDRVASFDNNYWVGYVTRTVPESMTGVRVTRLVYEHLPHDPPDIMRAARSCGFYAFEDLEPFHRRLLRADQPFA